MTAVHDLQVVEARATRWASVVRDPHDIAVDGIATPIRTLPPTNRPPQPSRFDWEKLGNRLDPLKPLVEWRRLPITGGQRHTGAQR